MTNGFRIKTSEARQATSSGNARFVAFWDRESIEARQRIILFLRLLALLILLWPALAATPLHAASSPEKRTFKTGANLFVDGFWEMAEKELAEFVRKYPESEYRAEAILLQAEARYKQKNSNGAVELLERNAAQAGTLADEYRFWVAESCFQNGNFSTAADHYSQLLLEFPKSPRRLEASYDEALCRFKLNDFIRVKDLMAATNSVFQVAARLRPNDELVARGNLLLAETLFIQKEFPAAEQVLSTLGRQSLNPELNWRRQYLLCRVLVAANRLSEAGQNGTNLVALALKTGQNSLVAESVFLQGSIAEQMSQPEFALKVYESRMDVLPPEQRRQALLKIIELTLAQNKNDEAIQKLNAFSTNYPSDPALDLAQLTLGELRLRQSLALTTNQSAETPAPIVATQSNLLKQAQIHIGKVIADFPQSPLWPKAQLNRGWILWLQGSIPESQPSFRLAAERLPFSEDQAMARFKLAETEFWQKDFSNAIQNFRVVTTNYAKLPRINDGLLDQAYYQILRASIALGDMKSAEEAMGIIFTHYPESYFAGHSLLLVGQALNRVDKPGQAREVFDRFVKRFPTGSPLLPEVELAIARTYVQEGKWNEAVAAYDRWSAKYSTAAPRADAEFDRAWVNYRADLETNALTLFTNFIARFPTNELAPQAQFWVGGFYFRHQDYINAEIYYQLLFQNTNWVGSDLVYPARMMAGRVALARQGFNNAGTYFKSLINDEKCPPDLVAEACFAYGDTLIEESVAEPTRAFDKYGEAIIMFKKIPQNYPTNQLVPAAWGRIGDCYLQLAVQNPKNYELSAEFYGKVIVSGADVAVRSQAEVGLGIVLEKQAALKTAAERATMSKQAMEHYVNVVHGNNLRFEFDERSDPFWVKKAGLAAATLAESQQQWETALSLYQRLKMLLPALNELWDKRIKLAQTQMDQQRGNKSTPAVPES